MPIINFKTRLRASPGSRLTGYPKKNIEDVRDDVWQKAQELSISVQKEDIHVEMQNGSVSISLDYSVPIDLAVYELTLNFHPHADNHSI